MDRKVRRWNPVEILIVAVCCCLIASVTGCNKALCASVVSKCLLQELCQCSMKGDDCPCCQDCTMCLGSLWEQCCSCVGLCSEHKGNRKLAARRSSVEDLPFPLQSLFQSLCELQGDAAVEWNIHTLPVSKELSQMSHMDHILLSTHSAFPSPPSVNLSAICTVMYFKPCMTMRRCQESCEVTGSSRYRWFHNGCCQCVGPDCYGYGNKDPLCQQCHPKGLPSVVEGDSQ
ncbi:twisted gastrulation protein homolog 1-A-like isoform X1 [Pyxicephalus adspersus]|uniref:twisted gastrulation protein homolog 1-A-like isoform X1 n=1 Tax=Pyxicephalus adspersus TaxID=30357 RepID=UPI003B5A2BF6